MKRWLAAMVLMAWGLADASRADTNELARPRQWTAASGAQLTALFVQLADDKVVLRNRAGERIQIPRAKLSAADQALLEEAFGPAAPPAAPEFDAPAPAADPEPAPAAPPVAPAAPSAAGPVVVAGTEISLGQNTTFRVPLDPDTVKELTKAGNEATEAAIGLWLPPDFDPSKTWNVLVVSATANSSSINCLFMYTGSAKDSGGWIVLAADGPFAPPKGDTTQWRWAMARAGLRALEAAWPAARNWPVAAAGFSGGAKRSGYFGALLCADGRTVIGMYMGGCNEDMASAGLKDYRPDRATFRKVPVYLSAGKKDVVATVAAANKVRVSLEATGFHDVRLETYDGAHEPDSAQITEALNWFKELHAQSAAPAAGTRPGARPGSRLPPPAPPAR